MLHCNDLAVLRRQKSCGERYIADVAASKFELSRHEIEVNFPRERSFRRPYALPDAHAIRLVRKRKLHDEANAARECFINVLTQIRGEDRNTLVLFHLLQQVCGLDIGVAIMGVANLRALSEQRVRLIKK